MRRTLIRTIVSVVAHCHHLGVIHGARCMLLHAPCTSRAQVSHMPVFLCWSFWSPEWMQDVLVRLMLWLQGCKKRCWHVVCSSC